MHPGTTIDCGRRELAAHNGNDVWARQAAPYGEAVFMDVVTRRVVRIDSARTCRRVAPTFIPGPQVLPEN